MQNSAAQSDSRVWFITGCSTGFGRALAEAALARGDRVVATARSADQIQDLERTHPGQALAVRLDVTNADEVNAAVQATIDTFGRIDVLVNNAGFGLIGAIEEVNDAETRRLFETNVFGLLHVTRAVLPHMRARRSGHVLNLSSVGGVVSLVGSGIYCASKFAVEGLTEALVEEVSPLGIRVTLIEPGPFRTDFAGRSIAMAPPMDDYAGTVGPRRQQTEEHSGHQPGDPVRAAAAMIQVVDHPNPPLRLVLGKYAVERVRGKLSAVARELDAWEATSLSADFPQAEGERDVRQSGTTGEVRDQTSASPTPAYGTPVLTRCHAHPEVLHLQGQQHGSPDKERK